MVALTSPLNNTGTVLTVGRVLKSFSPLIV